MNPQHFTAQDPGLCSPFQTDAKVIVFLSRVFREKTRSHWLPVSPAAPHPPPSFNPISPPFRNALQSFFLLLPPLFSLDHGALGNLGEVCVWLSQIYSSSLVKRDTVTSSVSGGPDLRLLSAKCQRSRTHGGKGEVTGWLVRRQA